MGVAHSLGSPTSNRPGSGKGCLGGRSGGRMKPCEEGYHLSRAGCQRSLHMWETFCFHRWRTEVYQTLHEQAVILDAKEAAKRVPPPPTARTVKEGHICPLTVQKIGQHLSPGAREELRSLKRMFAITFADFADKEGKKFVFQCRKDYAPMLLKEANSNSTYQFAEPTVEVDISWPFQKRGP